MERARQMDRAAAAGLSRRLLVALVAARDRLRGRPGRVDVDDLQPDLTRARADPAGRAFDETLAARLRRR